MDKPATDISISEPVRKQLRSALLEERDLIDSLRGTPHRALPGKPGSYLCVCKVAVRRPFDPETAELRELEVTLERMQSGWFVTRVEGLGSVGNNAFGFDLVSDDHEAQLSFQWEAQP